MNSQYNVLDIFERNKKLEFENQELRKHYANLVQDCIMMDKMLKKIDPDMRTLQMEDKSTLVDGILTKEAATADVILNSF